MNRNRFVKLTTLLTVTLLISLIMSISAFAATSTSSNEPMFYVEDCLAQAGESVTVQIYVENNPGILNALLTLSFDERLTLTNIEKGTALSTLDFTPPGNNSSETYSSPCNFLWDAIDDADASNGVVLLLTFTVPADAEPGTVYSLDLSYLPGDIADGNLDSVDFAMIGGTIEVLDYTPGDVNGDGRINGTDITLLRRYITGGYGVNIILNAADVNNDGRFNGTDITLIRRFITGGYGVTLKPSTTCFAHALIKVNAVEATCYEKGNIEYWQCSNCDKCYSDANGNNAIAIEDTAIDTIAHAFGDWIQTSAPTCTENGEERRDCANCDHYETKAISSTDHNYVSSVTAPTCTEQGYTTHTCSNANCGDTFTDTYVQELGHNLGDWYEILAPTCTTTGTNRRDCSRCEHYEVIVVSATGHSFSDKWLSDETYHWHGATCGHNSEVSGKVVHNFDSNGQCIVCDYVSYVKLETPVIDFVEYDTVYWFAVDNATSYTITVNDDYTYTTAGLSANLENVKYNDASITKAGVVSIKVQANGSGRYVTSDKSSEYSYYYVPEKQSLTSDEAKLYNYGIGYGYNLLDYEPIDAEMISQFRVLNINKLLTLGEYYNPAITTGSIDAYRFSSIEELQLHFDGSFNRNAGINIPMLGGIKNQMSLDVGVDYTKYDFNETYTVQEDFIYKTYGIKNYNADLLKYCLTETFLEDIKLAESMEEEAWLEYMCSRYGTHVILGVATGASYTATYTISTDKKDIAAKIDFELEKGGSLSLTDILGLDLGIGISLDGKVDWSDEDTEAHFRIDWKGSTSGGTTTPNNLDSAISNFESNINESNAVSIRFTTDGAISIGSLISMVDVSLGEKFENYINDKADEEYQALYSQYTKPSTLPVSVNNENGENVLRIDLSSYQNAGSLENAYNVNFLNGIFTVYPKMMGKSVDKIVVTGAFDEYSENLIDNFSIKLAEGWNKDITIVIDNLGVVCGSEEGIVDRSDVSSVYVITVEYVGANVIQDTDGNVEFHSSINDKKYDFAFEVNDDDTLDFTTIDISNVLRMPMASKEGNYQFAGWYDTNGVAVTDYKGYILDSYISSSAITHIRAEYIRVSEGLDYTLNDDGVSYSVTGIGSCTDTDIVIPNTYNGLPVTSIDFRAFYVCKSLTSITVGDSVTSIDSQAFVGCTSLTSVTIGDSVTTIGSRAFDGCTALTSVTLGDAVRSIASEAFSDCTSLTSITIPDSVKSIGQSAFYGCTALTSITIPNSVTSIGLHPFPYCSSLTSIEVDENNQYYKSIDGNLYNKAGTELVQYAPGKKDTSFTIPDTIGYIDDYQFAGCTWLTSITIHDNVWRIGQYAFSDCTSLESVNFGENCKCLGVGQYTFRGCTALTSITIPDSVTSIGDSAFEDCTSLVSVNFGANSDLTIIGSHAFAYCSSLTSITLPDFLASIGHNAFCGCTSLTSITIPDSVTSIGQYAFSDCTSLKSVNFGANSQLTSITHYVFSKCTALTSIEIPNSVTSIGERAFGQCESLTSITIPNSVTSIDQFAFSSCTSLESVTIGDSVTTIGIYAFCRCTSLESVTIGDSVTSISWGAFEDCTSLTNIYYHGTMEQWNTITKGDGWDANTGSYNLYCNDVMIYASGTTLKFALNNDNSSYYLKDVITTYEHVTVPETFNGLPVTRIGVSAFSYCTSIMYVTLPQSIKVIDNNAFNHCTALREVKGGAKYEIIGDGAFCGCKAMTAIGIPYTVTSIGAYAFENCTSLQRVTMSEGIITIGEGAFMGCSSLTHIQFNGSTDQWFAITKETDWDYNTGDYIISFGNGDQDITKEEQYEYYY